MTDMIPDLYDGGLMEPTTLTSYPGAHPRQACTRKKGYPTEKIARNSAATIRESSPGARVVAYACTFCGCWHVGAEPGARDREVTADTRPLAPHPSRRYGSFADYRRRDLGRKTKRRRRGFDDDDDSFEE